MEDYLSVCSTPESYHSVEGPSALSEEEKEGVPIEEEEGRSLSLPQPAPTGPLHSWNQAWEEIREAEEEHQEHLVSN